MSDRPHLVAVWTGGRSHLPCPRCSHLIGVHGQPTPEGTPCLDCPQGRCTPKIIRQAKEAA